MIFFAIEKFQKFDYFDWFNLSMTEIWRFGKFWERSKLKINKFLEVFWISKTKFWLQQFVNFANIYFSDTHKFGCSTFQSSLIFLSLIPRSLLPFAPTILFRTFVIKICYFEHIWITFLNLIFAIKIANIKMTKDEFFDSFIIEFIFFIFNCHFKL